MDFSVFGPHIPWKDGRLGIGEVRALTGRMTLAYFQLFCDPGRYDRESPTKQAGGLTASQALHTDSPAIQTVKLYRQSSHIGYETIQTVKSYRLSNQTKQTIKSYSYQAIHIVKSHRLSNNTCTDSQVI